jgi:hypothetical protein
MNVNDPALPAGANGRVASPGGAPGNSPSVGTPTVCARSALSGLAYATDQDIDIGLNRE